MEPESLYTVPLVSRSWGIIVFEIKWALIAYQQKFKGVCTLNECSHHDCCDVSFFGAFLPFPHSIVLEDIHVGVLPEDTCVVVGVK